MALSRSLEVNGTLTTLVLAANEIGDLGCSALDEALRVNSTLEHLDMANTDVEDFELRQRLQRRVAANRDRDRAGTAGVASGRQTAAAPIGSDAAGVAGTGPGSAGAPAGTVGLPAGSETAGVPTIAGAGSEIAEPSEEPKTVPQPQHTPDALPGIPIRSIAQIQSTPAPKAAYSPRGATTAGVASGRQTAAAPIGSDAAGVAGTGPGSAGAPAGTVGLPAGSETAGVPTIAGAGSEIAEPSEEPKTVPQPQHTPDALPGIPIRSIAQIQSTPAPKAAYSPRGTTTVPQPLMYSPELKPKRSASPQTTLKMKPLDLATATTTANGEPKTPRSPTTPRQPYKSPRDAKSPKVPKAKAVVQVWRLLMLRVSWAAPSWQG